MRRSSLDQLSVVLDQERDLLGRLVSPLDGPDERARLLWSISTLELHRAVTAREAGLELGLDGEPRLRDLIAAAPHQWVERLSGHRRALMAFVDRPVPDRAADSARAVQRSLRDFLG